MLGSDEERVILLNHKENSGLPFFVLLIPTSSSAGDSTAQILLNS